MLGRCYFPLYTIWGTKQVTLSQQQLFVINLVRFLNFNLKNIARFGIFLPKWLITLKICLFFLARCYQSEIKMSNFYSKAHVSVNYVKSGSCFLSDFATLIFIAIWVKYLLPERLSENVSVLFSHYSISHQWSSLVFVHQSINEGFPGPS